MASVNPYQGRTKINTGMMSGVQQGLKMTIEAPGLDEMIERLQKYAKIGDTDAKRVRAGMNKTISVVKPVVSAAVPYRTGKLQGFVFGTKHVWPEGNITGWVGVGAEKLYYGKQWGGLIPVVLEGGRRPNNNGRMAITPRHWLQGAFNRVQAQVNAIWANVRDQIVEDLAKKI